jgi:hypothetical protein
MEQKISELNDKEVEWINNQLEEAKLFIKIFSPEDEGKEIKLAILDKAFGAWIATKPTDIQQINGTINKVGIAFGQKMVDNLGLKWVIATDRYGTELAVYGYPKRGDVIIYPANFIAKRWERKESNFIEQAYKNIEKEIKNIKAKNKIK